jgi:phosphoribosyl 1,2-cyclic phosphate phosphodiesterase
MPEIELTFLGTGTSAGVPMIGCHCPVCQSADPRDRRTRPSALVRYDGLSVLIDMSPELRVQCLDNHIDRVDSIVVTHAHADHVMGLDDVRRFNVLGGRAIDIWADAETHAALDRCFHYAFTGPDAKDPVFKPHLVKQTIKGPFKIGQMTWMPVPLQHGRANVLGFRLGPLAYCTDVNAISEASYELLKGVEVLVLDALQPKPHPAHFSVPEAVDAARRIGAKRTWFTHITHNMFHAQMNAQLPADIQLAFDGQVVVAGAEGSR